MPIGAATGRPFKFWTAAIDPKEHMQSHKTYKPTISILYREWGGSLLHTF